jgi:hypothetical protein
MNYLTYENYLRIALTQRKHVPMKVLGKAEDWVEW